MRYLVATLAFVALGAFGQTPELDFQRVITQEGYGCPAVTGYQPMGVNESGSAFIAVACTNGDRHVVELAPDHAVSYVSTCGMFRATTNVKCFSNR